jgi:hypothetical protein
MAEMMITTKTRVLPVEDEPDVAQMMAKDCASKATPYCETPHFSFAKFAFIR